MSEIDLIKGKIADTEAKLKKAETKLDQLEEAEEKDEVKIQQCREDVRDLRNLQTEQQKEKNLLLANQGKKRSSNSIHCSSPCFCLFLSIVILYFHMLSNLCFFLPLFSSGAGAGVLPMAGLAGMSFRGFCLI